MNVLAIVKDDLVNINYLTVLHKFVGHFPLSTKMNNLAILILLHCKIMPSPFLYKTNSINSLSLIEKSVHLQ